jgi:hypothetical protein
MECSECGSDLNNGQKFCANCGIEIDWSQDESNSETRELKADTDFTYKPQSPEFSKRQIPKWVWVAAACVVIGVVASSISNNSNSGNSGDSSIQTSEAQSNADPTAKLNEILPFPPDGYDLFNENFAFKALPLNSYTCDAGTICVQVYGQAKTGCTDSMYVEVNFLDTSGNIVDYGNDITSVVPARTNTLLTFTSLNMASDTYKISKVTCNMR